MKQFLKKIYTPISWTIFIQVLFCIPGNQLHSKSLIRIEGVDKAVHFLFFLVFVVLWCYYYSKQLNSLRRLSIYFFLIFFIAIANGVMVEYVQLNFIPNRSFDLGDIIADMLGASVGYGLANIFLLREPQLKRPL